LCLPQNILIPLGATTNIILSMNFHLRYGIDAALVRPSENKHKADQGRLREIVAKEGN